MGIKEISFDLRPMSFNFIQAAMIAQIINENGDENNYSLIFANDTDKMINGLIEQIENQCEYSDWKIHYKGDESFEFIDSIQRPYFWDFARDKNYRPFLKDPKCRRIVFDSELLTELMQSNEIYPIMEEFKSLKHDDLIIEICNDWDNSLPISIMEFFEINHVNFNISDKVETSYRQIDLSIIEQHLEYTKKVIHESTNI